MNSTRTSYHDGSTDIPAIKNTTRRKFLCMASSAAGGLTFTDDSLFAANAEDKSREGEPPAAFELVTAQVLRDYMKCLHQKPGSTNLMNSRTSLFTAILTVERGYSEEEFEWHENHDHLFQIIDGATIYEIGGSPRNARRTEPGEWRAPDSKGAIAVPLTKGDMLLIPRGTPHRQKTLEMVTFMLISPMGAVKC